MAELTISEMLKNQKAADELHAKYKDQAKQKKAVMESAEAALNEKLRAGDSAAYNNALAKLDAATAEYTKYQNFADSTGRYLYSADEINSAWETEQKSFLSGDIKQYLDIIDSETKTIVAAFWNAYDILKTHYELGDEVREELCNPEECKKAYFALPAITRENLIERINCSHRRGEHP